MSPFKSPMISNLSQQSIRAPQRRAAEGYFTAIRGVNLSHNCWFSYCKNHFWGLSHVTFEEPHDPITLSSKAFRPYIDTYIQVSLALARLFRPPYGTCFSVRHRSRSSAGICFVIFVLSILLCEPQVDGVQEPCDRSLLGVFGEFEGSLTCCADLDAPH